MNFNHLIKKWRKESGLTLEELAKETNLTAQSISLYENEKRSVSIDTLKIFANVLNKNIELSIKEKGEILVTPLQRRKIEDIYFNEFDIGKQYESYKKLFDITSEEVKIGKLYDDMDEKEYVKYGPKVRCVNEQVFIYERNLHVDEVILYYAYLGCEVELKEDGDIKSVSISEHIPPFVPPRRTSEDGFITEQRRELLKLLIECFKFRDYKVSIFDIRGFRKKIGF